MKDSCEAWSTISQGIIGSEGVGSNCAELLRTRSWAKAKQGWAKKIEYRLELI